MAEEHIRTFARAAMPIDLLPVTLVAALSGCATVVAVGITADRAHTDHGEVALGWGVERDDTAHVVRWRECTSATECTCTSLTHERSSSNLELIDIVGSTTVQTADGQSKTVEVWRLRFGPPPPNRPTLSTETRSRMDQAIPEPETSDRAQ